jgi:hypothetical protein
MGARENTGTGALSTALDGTSLNMAYILRLDIVTDPVFIWTGLGDLSFGAGVTGDTALDGQTFFGITHLVADIGAVEDQQGGSGGLEIVLPGVDLTDEALRQIVWDRRKWQFLPGRLWMVFLDDNGAVIGKPVRMRSGKMDQVLVRESNDGTGVVKIVVESQQVYASEASSTRYSEQYMIDATDTSQNWIWQLANMSPIIGKNNMVTGGSGSGSGVSYSGGTTGVSPGTIGDYQNIDKL